MRNRLLSQVKTTAILLIVTLLLTQCNTGVSSGAELEDGFANPASENRPPGLWAWLNGYVDTTKLVYGLEQMKEKGMRGALIWEVGFDPGMGGPESYRFEKLSSWTDMDHEGIRFSDKSPLLKSGLTGKAEIVFIDRF